MQENAAIVEIDDRVPKEQHTELQQVSFGLVHAASQDS